MTLSKSEIAGITVGTLFVIVVIALTIVYYSVDRRVIVHVKRGAHSRLLTTRAPRILHLVLYSPSPQYDAMKQLTSPLYAHFEPQVQTVYYTSSSRVTEPTFADAQTLLLPGVESYHGGILQKTVHAIRHTWKPEFDFIVRSNVSTIVNWPVLLSLLQQQPSIHFGGKIIRSFRPSLFGKLFVQGTSIIMSKHVVQWLLNNLKCINPKFMDDVALSDALRRCPFVQQIHDFHDFFTTSRTFDGDRPRAFFRNKSRNRDEDVQRMKIIVQNLMAQLQ